MPFRKHARPGPLTKKQPTVPPARSSRQPPTPPVYISERRFRPGPTWFLPEWRLTHTSWCGGTVRNGTPNLAGWAAEGTDFRQASGGGKPASPSQAPPLSPWWQSGTLFWVFDLFRIASFSENLNNFSATTCEILGRVILFEFTRIELSHFQGETPRFAKFVEVTR